MAERVVVLGAGYAGLAAAKRAARRLRGTDAPVTLVNVSDRFMERVRLHQLAAGQVLADLPLRGLLDGTGVELVVAGVTGLDLGARVARLDTVPYEVGYDVLVYALGSGADLDAVPGAAEHAFTLAVAGEAVRLRSRLTEARTVAEVGPGGLFLENGHEAPADTVVWAAGFRVAGLAAASGLAVDEQARMLVDATLRSLSHPRVFGIGDAANAQVAGGRSRMSCQTGLPMGLQAGDAVAGLVTGRDLRPARIRHLWQNISLGRRDGVTQFTRADDSPLGAVLTGWASARHKEAVIRGTVWRLRHPGPCGPGA
ncbi:FAD-dependent pyridine nucleotide-disulfide oxidoreductase [Planomonospora sphaerica]|uniref:FAD-dependent pyridine nucleotide-disulfide oxidoreductase n=1 Tax=Planomonospora sphaerica TaxID=161355 RepID=A0A161LHR7_9ACTN|nr:FAD-dependent oxidoreductase [Planomonospora sphaerica]GAT67294.1 FAD-dependent pyridine nucleotide-disulfide oxidoreductase [Planomonospora sphaerica]